MQNSKIYRKNSLGPILSRKSGNESKMNLNRSIILNSKREEKNKSERNRKEREPYLRNPHRLKDSEWRSLRNTWHLKKNRDRL